MNCVAIIGTRNPSREQERLAGDLARTLSYEYGCHISTGAANGIDHIAMWKAKPGHLDVYLPWATYNREKIPDHAHLTVASAVEHKKWFRSVDTYHPNPDRLSRGEYALHARNYGIVEGADLVIAMPAEYGAGGTSQGIRVAHGLLIPVMSFVKGTKFFSTDRALEAALQVLELKEPQSAA